MALVAQGPGEVNQQQDDRYYRYPGVRYSDSARYGIRTSSSGTLVTERKDQGKQPGLT